MADNVYQLNFKLQNGETKSVQFTAPQGKNGADGKTPVKGTDYWTEADKEEILAALAGSGGSGGSNVASGSYDGTGTYGVNNANSLTFPFVPKLVLIVAHHNRTYEIDERDDWEYLASETFLHSIFMVIATDLLTTEYKGSMKKSADGKTIYWYSSSASMQRNESRDTYYWIAI